MRSNNPKHLLGVGAVVAIVAALVAPVHAHNGPGHGFQDGMGMYFDPATVTTVSGVLQDNFGDWEVRGHGNHTGGGMAFAFESEAGDAYDLMLAPDWFLEEAGITLETGQRITVTGSVVKAYDDGRHGHGGPGHGGPGHGEDADYVIVTVLQVDGSTLSLRDEDGYPLWRGGPGWGGHRWFDPDAVTTVSGTLGQMLGIWSAWGHGNHTGNAMHYLLEGDTGETLYAMLGPWWFLEGQGLELSAETEVEIRGSIVDSYWSGYDEHRFLIATEITVGGKTAQLRDDWGYPLWHGTGWHYYSPSWAEGARAKIEGTVVRIRRRTHGRFLDRGYELTVKAGGRRHLVFVAPLWDVQHMGLTLRKGQEIKVAGVLLGSGNRPELVTRHLVAEGKRWKFRSWKGVPFWVVGAK